MTDSEPALILDFRAGTLELSGLKAEEDAPIDAFVWDPREACFRAPAKSYAAVVRYFAENRIPFEDRARRYDRLELSLSGGREPRPYQQAALQGWERAQRQGVIVLPTGAGKSFVAMMAMVRAGRSALVIAPTLDLVRQWYDLLRNGFHQEVGIVGGGEHRLCPLTVTTYDSAYLQMNHIGARFGLVVFDECHHLPGESYRLAAEFCLAPFRLGLSATPERADGRDSELQRLIGPVVFEKEILELSGRYLADYDTERFAVSLNAEERAEYEAERAIYIGFLRRQRIRMGSPRGFSEFIMRASQSQSGLRAMAAYRRQREIAFAAPAKLDHVDKLLKHHAQDRALIFTQDNRTAYAVSRRFLVPAITHQTKVRERSYILEAFARGDYGAVVTSKVLNEGVDVPEANVAIVISGSGSVREHVQRLGRILRPRKGKRAVLYELVSAETSETRTSERRREHSAYQPG